MDKDGAARRTVESTDGLKGALSREQLYALVWQEPLLRVAGKLGVSSSYMAKVCTELRVPRPSRGYWAQLEFGKAPERPALPPAQTGDLTAWQPGDFIGASQREARTRAKAAEPRDSTQSRSTTKSRRSNQAAATQQSHPLLRSIKPLFEKTRDSKDGILRPYKRLMADILASRDGLDLALHAADRLYRALDSRGHRVMVAGYGEHMRRAEVDLREMPRKNQYQQAAWWPERPTVVYIGDIPVGLTVLEMTEVIEMMYVGNSKYVPVSSLTAEQRRRMTGPHYWTSNKDQASGRLRLQAYCTSQRVGWTKQWSESKPGELSTLLPGIIHELEMSAPMLAEKIEAARLEAEGMHRKRVEEQRVRREAEEQARRQKQRQEARQELHAAITAWDEARRIAAFFLEVEQVAGFVAEDERAVLLERIAYARQLLGDPDPVGILRRWKKPEERG